MINDKVKELLNLAVYAGKIMLENGAETYRVEDSIERICKSFDGVSAEPFPIQTGIFVSIKYKNEVYTSIIRVKKRTINLSIISDVNAFSRDFMSGNISIDEGFKILDDINASEKYPKLVRMFGGGFIGGFFSLMFGGNIMDFISSFIICFMIIYIYDYLNKYNTPSFINVIICSAIITFLALISSNHFLGLSEDMIIIGSIMPLVPGVAITNALRDLMSGDYLAGTARAIEAIITASGIAFGVFIALEISNTLLGGIL